MDLTPAPKPNSPKKAPGHPSQIGRDTSGIALFMVIASVSLLTILVTEFTYIAQISQTIAFSGLDQLKAHYVAKSGLKLSLLRLKAYLNVKGFIDTTMKGMGATGGGIPGLPKGILEKIWSFPFMYPIPTNIPGINSQDKEMLEKFQKESGLEGSLSALIESESSKYNLNLILTPAPAPGPSGNPGGPPPQNPTTGPSGTPATAPSAAPSFSPQEARDGLYNFFNTILTQKFEKDSDFATNYRDFRLDEFVDQLIAWSDRTYDRRTSPSRDKVPMKRAPFYSLSELHMIPTLDDELYNLFVPNLTVSPASGINVNTMKDSTLRALIPAMTLDEVKEFFKFRDSVEVDNLFASVDKFYDYLSKNVAAFKGNQQALTDLQNKFAKANIVLTTDENQFKITIRAEVNHSVRIIEAWVSLGKPTGPNPAPSGQPNPALPPGLPNPNIVQNGQTPPPDPGLRITFMRVR